MTVTMPKVIGENEWLIAIDKPAGLIVHSDGRTHEPSLADWIAREFPALRGVGGAWVSPQGEEVPLNGLVHRLDRTTSGVLLAAKTKTSFDYLRGEFKAKRVGKKYLAWVYGRLTQKEGRIVAEIMRTSVRPKRWYARPTTGDDSRAAITGWKLIKTKDEASLLEVEPKTGRTHQIRVHLAYFGHPIIADHMYAANREPILGFTRPALHAESIALVLPNGMHAGFEAPLPPDFEVAESVSQIER